MLKVLKALRTQYKVTNVVAKELRALIASLQISSNPFDIKCFQKSFENWKKNSFFINDKVLNAMFRNHIFNLK
jgi:hypothetical protein